MKLDNQSILSAVGEVLAGERKARAALEARVAELTDAYGNVIRQPGPTGERGAQGDVGRDGRDGRPGERGLDGPAGPQGERGEVGPVGEPAYSGRACGLYSATEAYRAMDVVAFNGSEWRAVVDNPGPLPGDGWRQGAKGVRGRPGDKGATGERGARGEKGDRGEDGIGVEELTVSDYSLMLMRSDGSVLSCDLLPMIERFFREASA
jgi:hypothetical protein